MRRTVWSVGPMVVGALALSLVSANTASATLFTTTSSIGVLPGGVTQVGGIVFQAKGLNGNVVTSQLAASTLFVGNPSGSPIVIGTQTGFTPAVLSALGGGLVEVAVRISLFDGDTAAGNFDFNDNFLRLNGFESGANSNFSSILTQQTNSTGTTAIGANSLGFNDNQLRTGFFSSTDATFLSNLFTSLAGGSIVYGWRDTDPNDQFLDFTQGVDGGLINVGQPPVVTNPVPEPATMALALSGLCGFGLNALRRRKTAA